LRAELSRFLEIAELDHLQRAAAALLPLHPEEAAELSRILLDRTNLQAVSNLLFHPEVIPDAMRVSSLLRALTTPSHPYELLAAVVGVQEIAPEQLDSTQRRDLVEALLEVIRGTEDVRSSRAAVSIAPFLTADDGPRLAPHVLHADDTTATNVLAWFLKTFESSSEEAFRALFGDAREAAEKALEKRREHLAKKQAGGLSFAASPLFSYIPNLSDVLSAQ
jgi:hypothetical protein